MDATLETALPVGAESARTRPSRITTAIVAALPFVIAWVGVVTTARGNMAWYAEEDGLAENLQVLFLLAATAGAAVVARLRWRRGERVLGLVYVGLALAFFFVAGEEISWGQRIFGIETPEAFAERNIQQEITLHNTHLLTPLFSLAQLALGGGVALAALIPWGLVLPPRLDAIRRALVPGPALAGYFALSAAWRLYRYVGVTPETPAAVGEMSEIPELALYLGLALFTLEQWRRVRATPPTR